MKRTVLRVALLGALALGSGAAAGAVQSTPPGAGDEGLEVLQLRPQFYVIAGAGANIAVQIGDDGVVVVDPGTAANAERVLAEIRKLTKQPIRYIINTNADPDHVGGNEKFSAAGQSIVPTGGLNEIAAAGGRAVIFAEEHVLSRMSAPVGRQAPYPVGEHVLVGAERDAEGCLSQRRGHPGLLPAGRALRRRQRRVLPPVGRARRERHRRHRSISRD
jgi:alkyl sulfatase BDS1-like metallo-beta-lactamase superfamily hydrolase